MKKPSALVVTAFLLSGLVTAWVLLHAPAESTAAASVSSPRAAASESILFSLMPGRVLTHRVTLEQRTEVSPFSKHGDAMRGDTVLDVELRLAGVAQDAEGVLASLEIARVHEAEIVVQDQPLLDSVARGALVGPRATVRVLPSGRVTGLQVPAGAPPMFVRVLQLVLAETQLARADGVAWSAEERTASWQVNARYARQDVDADAGREALVTRTAALKTVAFPGALEPTNDARFDSARSARITAGVLRSLTGEEGLVVRDARGKTLVDQRTNVDVTLVSDVQSAAPSAPLLAEMVSVDPHVIARDDDAARTQALSARIEGLSREELLSTLTAALPTGSVPDHDRFLWRASGLLQREPALVASLAPLFDDARGSHESRALILDLLVGARHGTAQALLCQLLDSPLVEQDARSGLLRQRLSFVRHPTAETLAFVREKASGADPRAASFRDPARMSLGSMAGALARTDRSEEAVSTAQLLVSLHDAAASDEDKRVIVRALGNAGIDGFDGPILAAARAPERDARASAASALRKMRSERSRDTLLSLAADSEALVSRRALDAIDERPFEPAVSASVLAALRTRRIPDAAYQAVVSLLGRHARTDADARAALELILTQDVNDKQIKGRVRQILKAVP
jgi:hypothetical protein